MWCFFGGPHKHGQLVDVDVVVESNSANPLDKNEFRFNCGQAALVGLLVVVCHHVDGMVKGLVLLTGL